MKFQKILVAIFFCLFFTTCKKDSTNPPGGTKEELAFQSYQMMEAAAERFIEIGDSMDVAPPEALYYTSLWAQNQPGVEYALTLDSAYLIIRMTSGYESTIALREIGVDGLSVYRGSAAGTGRLSKTTSSTGGDCSNRIQNKKVLLYAAYEYQFYSGTEFQTRIVDMIENGDVSDIDVTVLKNQQCTIDAMLTFDQYGLVIMDTHGGPSAICTGVEFYLDSADIPNNVNDYLTLIGDKIGAQHIQAVIDARVSVYYAFEYDPQLQIQEQWDKYKQNLNKSYQVELTSKGVREMMPDLSNTIVFANACYSGWTATEYTRTTGNTVKNADPIKPAWMSRNPLTFYGYESAADGVSYKAPDAEFCKPNEDTLIKSFFYDGDSTGNAHLADGLGGALFIEYPWNNDIGMNNNHGPLRFNHYASPSWCYGNCGDTITDSRDGKKYPTVCIGNQVWMAENLNYAGAGICYDNDPANCNAYGRLYSFAETTGMDTSSANPSGIRGICLEGWHVPSIAEWAELFAASQGITKLRATTGWPLPNNNTNESGLSLLPGGKHNTYNSGFFADIGEVAYFWSSSRTPDGQFYSAVLISGNNYNPNYEPSADSYTDYFSCRCVKD